MPYDIQTKQNLIKKIKELQTQIEKHEDKNKALDDITVLAAQYNRIELFHQKSIRQPGELISNIRSQLNQFKKQYQRQEKVICDYLLRSINEIENLANDTKIKEINEQCIYSLIIGVFEHWRKVLYEFNNLNRFYDNLLKQHPATEDDLTLLFKQKNIVTYTYKQLLDKKLLNDNLAQYNSNKPGCKKSVYENEANQSKQLYEEFHDSFIITLAKALTPELLASPKSALYETIKQAQQLVKKVSEDVSKKNISHDTAYQLLQEAFGILKCLDLNSTQKNLNGNYNKAAQHAIKIAKLADQHKARRKAKAWGCALLFAGLALITLAVFAFLAVTSGSFLGLTFATTAIAKTITGINVVVMSEASKGALVGGFFSAILGVSLTAGAINRFFFHPELKISAATFTNNVLNILEENKKNPSTNSFTK